MKIQYPVTFENETPTAINKLVVMSKKQAPRSTVWINEEGLAKIRDRMAKLKKPDNDNKRGKSCWTVEYLSQQSYVSLSTIKRLLNKKVPIDQTSAISILDKLGFESSSFIDEHDQMLKTYNQNQPLSSEVDWQKVCLEMLQEQQEDQQIRRKATEMGFEVKVYVPLGLVERKQQQRRSGIINTEQIDKLDPEVITRIYNHKEFLDDIIGQQPKDQDQHIAIIGEPGAGKTTLLDRIATYIKNKNQDLFICISLANLQGKPLKTYILNEWLPKALDLSYPELDPESLEKTFQHRLNQGGVWLLLDGADEGKLSLAEIQTELSNFVKIRVVLTCRTNVWDIYINNPLTRFKTYKTRDFKPEQIDKFIQDWFEQAKDEIRGKKLQAKLKEPQRDRIRQLVTNPLRLALLCQIFYKDKNAELPETKAGLYEQFVRYFYEWKPAIVGIDWGTQPQLQDKLHQGLGKLAIAGLDSDYRYRLPLSLIKTEIDDQLFKLAWDLGWLTLVDREEKTDEVVYAFYHPTFQEYFAALAVDNWDFFLPRDHVDRPVRGKRYRIFEDYWRDVMLFWIGNKHIKKDDKENFIEALANFEDNCEDFYWHRCFFIASVLTSEFKNCSIAYLIIKQIVFWRLGYCHIEEQQEMIFINIINKYAEKFLLETELEMTVSNLIEIINTTDDQDVYLRTLWSLGKINYTNQLAIEKLIEIIKNNQDDYLINSAVFILGEIAYKNKVSIETFIQIITHYDDDYIRGQAAWSLGKIDPDNELAIITLIKIISGTEDHYLVSIATKSLIEIALGNILAIKSLTNMLNRAKSDNQKVFFAWALGNVDYGNELAISSLIEILANNHSEIECLKISTFISDIIHTNKFAFNQFLSILKNMSYMFDLEDICEKIFNKLTYKNENSIHELLQLIQITYEPEALASIIKILGIIAIGSELVISTLIQIIVSTEQCSIRSAAVEGLTNILENYQQYINVVKVFRPYIKNKNYKENYEIYTDYFRILWHCAQHMSYPKFYQAWHESDTTKEQLETSYNDLTEILKQLQPNDKKSPLKIDNQFDVQVILIDNSNFINPDNPALDIYVQMVKQNCPKCSEIRPKTMQELNSYWQLDVNIEDKLLFLLFYQKPKNGELSGWSDRFLQDLDKFQGNIGIIAFEPINSLNLRSFLANDSQLIENISGWMRSIILEQ
ncbi:conserved hypothetical protein [Planktothrix agardhii]|nr:conserved hypothetical protein [Planktothrix agardhii]